MSEEAALIPEEEKRKRGPAEIKDFDQLAPGKRRARIGGKVIDVTKIPSRVALEMQRRAEDMPSSPSSDGFNEMLELVAKICQATDKEVTVDWLLDNTGFVELVEFCLYVTEPIRRKAEQVGNAEPARS